MSERYCKHSKSKRGKEEKGKKSKDEGGRMKDEGNVIANVTAQL
jgi:hypothetical protein